MDPSPIYKISVVRGLMLLFSFSIFSEPAVIGTQERVLVKQGIRAIRVRATEVQLYKNGH